MNPTCLRPQFGRFISLLVCGALLVSIFVATPRSSAKSPRKLKSTTQPLKPQGNSQRQREPAPRDNGRRVDPVPPQTGPPAANLPNLDEVRQQATVAAEAPAAIPSIMRSRRKPLESRRGRKVGDRLPPDRGASWTKPLADEKRPGKTSGNRPIQGSEMTRSHHARMPSPVVQGGGAVTYLSDLNWSYSYNDYYATTRDQSVDGTTLTLNGVTYAKGLGVHAYAEVRYNLAGGYTNFTSDVGVDDFVTGIGSVTFEVWADGQKLYDSGVMTFSSATQTVNVNVTGKQELKLIVTQAGDGPGYDHADWAGARLTPVSAAVYLSDLNWSYQYCDYYTTTRDHSVDGTTLMLNGVTYAKGLGVHAYAEVRYNLAGGYTNFTSDVGVDDFVTSIGSVTFEVWADGQKLYDSGVMTFSSATQTVNVNVTGKQELKLIVTQAGDGPGYDHADWAGARLIASSNPISSTDQYVQNFLQWGLGRSPTANESNYWTDIMRAAYSQGQPSVLMSMNEFGMTVFESAEYAGRNRTNHEYVYDLYKTYLKREPDPDGWGNWTSHCNQYGRESVRKAFEECDEFHGILATLSVSGASSVTAASLATAQVDPFNQAGDQIQARDAEWSLPLISLPGRAGLNLGLSLSYSSMVWTHSGPYVYFDQDYESLSPGFTIGFPTVQFRKFDAQTKRNVYVFTAAGRHIELRQLGTSNTYEAADSSYLQLIDYGGSLSVTTMDGTRMSFASFVNNWCVTQIEDRNGNFITVNNDWRGDIQNLTDTLGRTIYFNYDNNANLNSVTQGGRSQPWATFGWGDPLLMSPTISNAISTYNNEQIPVLRQVGLADGTRYNFDYTGNGQVRVFHRYAYDNHELTRSTITYEAATTDCPRVSQILDWVENWDDAPDGVITQLRANQNGSHEIETPDHTIYKETYGNGWQNGLVVGTEVRAGGAAQKWTTTNYRQDNESVDYQTNPRVTITDVFDGSNHKHTTVGYQTFTLPTGTSCSLPNDVYEYEANATTIARREHTDYILDAVFLNRRIVGLVGGTYLYDGGGNLQSKTTYCYDCDPGMIANTPATPIQHDSAFDTTDLNLKRGNLMVEARWDVSDPLNANKQLYRHWAYDTAGSVISTQDPLNHQTSISYTDQFAANGADLDAPRSFATLAYPTTITDADGYSSKVRYNYEFGAATWKQTPQPNVTTNSPGPAQKFEYDSATRLQRVTNLVNGAYTRYEYSPNWRDVSQFTTIQEGAGEAFFLLTRDGVGRARATATKLPGGPNYAATWTRFDKMGRAVMQSNPTEIDSGWQPTGDDLYNAQTGQGGWIFTQQTYDWKGRPLETTHLTDGTVKYASYEGCGCAGGEMVTLTDEVGRQQKIYSDVLGRQWKTEVLNENGSVYSTITNRYNSLDRITRVRQYAGAAPFPEPETEGSGYQTTSMAYDGYGRLQSRHMPEQQVDPNLAGSTDHTTWNYHADDTIDWIKDARGAKATYEYNNRRFVSHISYEPANGGADTPDVWFAYDAAGNRTSMTDGLGSQSYSYNSLSQLIGETRTFTGVGSFTLGYDYNLAGRLKKITDSTNMTINYGYDSNGRLNGVTGSDNLFAGVSNYASNFQYRAWGGLKGMTDGTGHVLSLTYNSRLQPSQFDISGGVVHQNYDHYNDGRISFVHNTTDANFDRSYSYDQIGRLSLATSGGTARNDSASTPYRETFGYDALSNLTSRFSSSWSQNEFSDAATYNNNKRSGWGYDADGRNTTIDTRTNTFDAAGQQTLMTGQKWVVNHYVSTSQASGYDGDGLQVQETIGGVSIYYLRSTILGGAIVEELSASGQKNVGYVYAAGQLLARQAFAEVAWSHNTPAGTGKYEIFPNSIVARTEFDPLGADVGLNAPVTPDTGGGPGDIGGNHIGGLMDSRYADLANPSAGCTIDGMAASCSMAMGALNSGAGYEAVWATRYTTVSLNGEKIFSGYTGAGWVEASSMPFGYSHTTGEIPLSSVQQYSNQLGSANFWWGLFNGSIGLGAPSTSYVPTYYTSDIGHDVSTAYHVNIFGGAEYFADPGNIGPTIAFGPKYQNLIQPFKDAFDDAVNRLNKKNCAKLFGGLQKALDALNSATYRLFDKPVDTAYKDGKSVPSVIGAMTASDNTVFINLSGPFFNGPDLKMGGNRSFKADFGTGLKGKDLAALLLLHELGHQVGKWGSDAGVGDKDKNLAHSMAVKDACF